jgi:hypothetical protein
MCARHKMFPSSANWVQAYLQCDMKKNKLVFIELPNYWKSFLPPDLAVYCGKPLLLKKALYGYPFSGKRLYEEQEQFMLEQGFSQSCLLGLWYKHIENCGLFLVLIFADDQLIASTSVTAVLQKGFNG